ncbi:aminopeptidase [Deinococcus arenicola]|uniref:Aminopeptidase n=1 Tax=Deinococcus arenicola TaxID=2994950 RepID=A0ABU4DU35_9DEIO|nr:aminopeptidase [Deinococcus sp. ZS9-10]MDV6375940.1 aminopeptidase [Deinococcus sp. ZS9-10]
MRPAKVALIVGGAVALVAALSACSDVRYLAQAAGGQLDLLRRARPIEGVLADPATDAEVRRKLELVGRVRAFAIGELGLPDHGSFLKYVDVGRSAVVWNVFSAPPDSISLRTSCFPIAGCVTYRGYFHEADARAYANTRRAAGDDVSVGGVSAYSTLGYLKDPILSTMLSSGDATLIRTVIHELSHPALYVKDDTIFNESFAVSVENEGMRRWLKKYGTPELAEADRLAQERAAGFEKLLLQTRGELEALYAQKLAPTEIQTRKAAVIGTLNDRYAALKVGWGGYAGYDGWFARGANNASLGAVAAYSSLVPDFQGLLERNGGDIPRFIGAAAECAGRPAGERQSCLKG